MHFVTDFICRKRVVLVTHHHHLLIIVIGLSRCQESQNINSTRHCLQVSFIQKSGQKFHWPIWFIKTKLVHQDAQGPRSLSTANILLWLLIPTGVQQMKESKLLIRQRSRKWNKLLALSPIYQKLLAWVRLISRPVDSNFRLDILIWLHQNNEQSRFIGSISAVKWINEIQSER